MTNRVTLALTAAMLVSVQAVQAQAHQHGQPGAMQQHMMGQGCMGMGAGMGHGMGMMMGGLPGPARILNASDELALTAQQKTQLESIQNRMHQTMAPRMEQVMAAHQKMSGLLEAAQPDMAAYEATMKGAMDQVIAMHMAATRAAVDARAVLTAEQRTKLNTATSLMGGMMCRGEGGMMHHGPGK